MPKKPTQSICPNGHRPPIVQYLKDEKVYCCTRCAITWTGVRLINDEPEKAGDAA